MLSSEWTFSPFTYPAAIKELPQFVFIGIPASECQNPLIMPLAGHELGHVVWGRKGVKEAFEAKIRDRVVELYRVRWSEFTTHFRVSVSAERIELDLFARRIWNRSLILAQRQIEEIFCDFVGLAVFGPAFLHAFRYLLAPSLGQYRAQKYPSLKNRALYMVRASESWNIPTTEDFGSHFSQQKQDLSPDDKFILDIADETTASLYEDLIPLVSNHLGNIPLYSIGDFEEKRAKACIHDLVPSDEISSVVPIINAAWEVRLDIDRWDILHHIEDDAKRRREKLRVLRDLTLKSFETYEYYKRLRNNAS